jgi:hypothetical protein
MQDRMYGLIVFARGGDDWNGRSGSDLVARGIFAYENEGGAHDRLPQASILR